ncbi:MAG: ribulose-phosphate 3-epimerase [Candidatus Izemoplasmataceae bacterium]|jgi:ribulose-phosphate 3-epimerase|uniref:ribulose-phosphate 3-epimerase n=1 Tax=Liberiplasma polymorphum TaxID=3374570 RepID=UPI003770E668
MKIAPSILSADFSILKEEIQTVETAEWIHIDVMDGHFVPNITIGPLVVDGLRKHTNQVFDTHLMIDDPEFYLDSFIDAGSDQITFHVETVKDPLEIINKIKSKGAKAGISLKPKTPIEAIKPYLKALDLVLVMSVEPGFGGQAFMMESLEKMQFLHDYKKEHGIEFDIVVDGGINVETAELCKKHGATVLVAGSYIFKQKDRKSAIESLR